MATAGPTMPSTGANSTVSSGSGYAAWANPGRITAEDASDSVLTYTDDSVHDSDALRGSAFAWPAGIATVTNVLWEAKVKMVYAGGSVPMHRVDPTTNFGSWAFTGGTGNPLAWVTVANGAPLTSGQTAIIANTDIYDMFITAGSLDATIDVDAYRVTITYTLASGGARIFVATRRAAAFRQFR